MVHLRKVRHNVAGQLCWSTSAVKGMMAHDAVVVVARSRYEIRADTSCAVAGMGPVGVSSNYCCSRDDMELKLRQVMRVPAPVD